MSNSTVKMDGRLPILEPNELTPSQSQLYERIDHTLVPWAEQAGFIAKRQNGTLVGPVQSVPLQFRDKRGIP